MVNVGNSGTNINSNVNINILNNNINIPNQNIGNSGVNPCARNVENVVNVENTKNINKVDNVDNVENIENVDNIENSQRVEDNDIIKSIKNNNAILIIDKKIDENNNYNQKIKLTLKDDNETQIISAAPNIPNNNDQVNNIIDIKVNK